MKEPSLLEEVSPRKICGNCESYEQSGKCKFWNEQTKPTSFCIQFVLKQTLWERKVQKP